MGRDVPYPDGGEPNVFRQSTVVTVLSPAVVDKSGLNYPQPFALHMILNDVA